MLGCSYKKAYEDARLAEFKGFYKKDRLERISAKYKTICRVFLCASDNGLRVFVCMYLCV